MGFKKERNASICSFASMYTTERTGAHIQTAFANTVSI